MWRSLALRAVVLLLLAAATSGCWLQTGFGSGKQGFNGLETGVTAANVADLTTRWTASVGGAAGEALVDRGTAFVTDSSSVTALALATGAERWSTDVCCGRHVPAILGGQLRVASAGADTCRMLSLDPATGTSTELAPFGPQLPGFAGGCDPGDVLAVGSQAVSPWSVLVGPFPGGPPGPCNRGQNFFLGGPGVSSVDVDTAAVWDHDRTQGICTIGDNLPPIPPIGPVSSDGTSVLYPRALTLNALPLDCTATGCPVAWSVDIGSSVGAGATIVGPAVVLDSGDLALAASDGHVVVVDGTSHQVEWTASVGATIDQPLAATSAAIFATGTSGTVAALPAAGCGATTCAADWTATLASPASARPSIGGDVLYVGSADGTVTAFATTGCGAATCAGLWTGSTPARVTGAPAIFSGTIVVGSSDGTVTAFALPRAT